MNHQKHPFQYSKRNSAGGNLKKAKGFSGGARSGFAGTGDGAGASLAGFITKAKMVPPEGFEPPTTVPKTVVISISLQGQRLNTTS